MPLEPQYLSIITGQSRGVGAAMARTGLLALEPLYRITMFARNTLFDKKIKSIHSLGRPTISVGNLTAGGTGKTPVVQWIADQLLARGRHPAILLRGYRAKDGVSDEAELLKKSGVEVEANPDRRAGAATVLARSPQTDVFLLDDGFQHRRAARDLDLVLIDATKPFGNGHVIPRGLLRESPAGLRRAGAILITRADDGDRLPALISQLRRHAPTAPIFISRHAFAGLIDAHDQIVDPSRVGRCLAMAGIGNPESFYQGLRQRGLQIADTWSPGDHHVYTQADAQRLRDRAMIGTIVVTEKDWVKLRRLKDIDDLPIARAQLKLDFADGHAEELLKLILQTL
jgi:tetraacyldisaccharide 4'-kinase